jgi:hypothetical protein
MGHMCRFLWSIMCSITQTTAPSLLWQLLACKLACTLCHGCHHMHHSFHLTSVPPAPPPHTEPPVPRRLRA